MKISTLAVAAALPLASGQRETPHGTRGASTGGRRGGDAEEKKKAVDILPIKEAVAALQSKPDVAAAAEGSEEAEGLLSDAYKYESSKWEARGIAADVSLDVDAFEDAVANWSESICDLGITATLFDKDSNQVFQKSFGTKYTPFVKGGYSMSSSPGHGPLVEGWTGDTVYTPYSNTKMVAAATYLASVVDTGLGFLDEPISTTFPNLAGTQVGTMTPRHMLSHTSGLKNFNREQFENDPYYSCKFDRSTTLRECVEANFFTDDSLIEPPGSKMRYNNEPFDILAVLAVEKTGIKSWGRIFKQYIAGPLGMKNTSYKCPVVRSTHKKPGVAWGLCSTGHDFPKLVQMLSNDGMSPSGKQVLSKNSVSQIFTEAGLGTGDMLFSGTPSVQMTRCYPRLVKGALKDFVPDTAELSLPLTSVAGYGLGTMFFLGSQGEIKGHAGSTGGAWLVAPGRFSAYLVWMCSSLISPELCGLGYPYVADVLEALESSGSVTLKNAIGGEDGSQEIDVCGGYVDLFSAMGVESYQQVAPPPTCSDIEQGRAAEEVHPLVGAMNLAGQIL